MHQAIAEVDPVFAVNAVYVYEQVPPMAFMSSCLAASQGGEKLEVPRKGAETHAVKFDQFFNISVDGRLAAKTDSCLICNRLYTTQTTLRWHLNHWLPYLFLLPWPLMCRLSLHFFFCHIPQHWWLNIQIGSESIAKAVNGRPHKPAWTSVCECLHAHLHAHLHTHLF